MPSEPAPRFYPRVVLATPQVKAGPADRWFEFLTTGQDSVGGLARLTAIFARRNVNLVPSGGYYLLDRNSFVWNTFANFAHAKSTPERVAEELRREDFVSKVESVEVDVSSLDQFLFPVYLNNGYRGVILSAAPLLKVEQRLTEMLGTSGEVLMFEEGKAYAKESVEQFRHAIHGSGGAKLLNDVGSWLRTTGWGIFEFDLTQFVKEDIINVLVREPLIPPDREKRMSSFLNGLVAGVIEKAFEISVALTSSSYEETNRTLSLVFNRFSRSHDSQAGSVR